MKKTISILLSACIALTSCESFLDREPVAEVGSGDYFKDETSLLPYTNGFLQKYTPGVEDLGYGDGYSDIVATKQSFTFLTNASWTPDLQSGWSIGDWTPIYNINYFLAHMREAQGLSEEVYAHYEGTARFWRAWQYFEKVKTFGAVPWYDAPIDPEDMAALYKPRDSREYVMDRVLEDLDFACEHCYDSGAWINSAQINRYIALAYKSRVCLFEGTYRKYHSVDPSTGKPWEDTQASERFLRAAAEAAYELMQAGIYSIVNNPANVRTQYRKLFTEEAIDRTEIIWAREMSVGMTTFHDLTWRYTSGSYGQRWSLDQDFVKTYLNLDGSRHTATGEEFAREVENRDYRLGQSIITPGYEKLVGGTATPTPPDFTVTLTGYQIIKYNIDDKNYESAKVSYNSLPIIRYAEVLLNYAEAVFERDGQISDEDLAISLNLTRKRINPEMPDLTNDFVTANNLDMRTEIRRERTIEFFDENFRIDDLKRWKTAEDEMPMNLTGVKWKDTDFESRWPDASFKDKDGEGCIIHEKGRNWHEKHYLLPLPTDQLKLNSNLKQNPGWNQ